MVYVLNAGHEVLLFAVTGFVIILGAFLIVLLCRCCRRCRSRRSTPQPEDYVSADGLDAPLIPAGRGAISSYPGGTFYGNQVGYQQQVVYPTGSEYYSRGPPPHNGGEFAASFPYPPGQNPPAYGEPSIPNAPPYGGEPPPPYDSVREAQQQRFYSGPMTDQNYSYQQQQPYPRDPK